MDPSVYGKECYLAVADEASDQGRHATSPREAWHVKCQHVYENAIADLSKDTGNKPVGTAVKGR